MKHFSALPLLLAAAWTVAPLPVHAQAASITTQFDVVINLSSACELTTAPSASFNYTSFQATDATFDSKIGFRCTKGLLISGVSLDQTDVTDNATELRYTLALGPVPAAGTGIEQTVTVKGTMAGRQSGACGTSSCTNATSTNRKRTLTFRY